MAGSDLSPEELSDLIGLVYDSAFEEDQWKSLIDRLCDLFPGTMACVYGYDGEFVLPQYALSGAKKFLEERLDFNGVTTVENLNFVQAMEQTPNGWVSRTKRYFTDEEWDRMDVYQNFLRPLGMRHSLHMKLDSLAQRGAVIAFSTPEDPALEAKVHDALFNLLRILSPHAVRALRLARALTLAKRSTEIFGGFLDSILLPMLVTDASGRFLFANASGRRVLDRGDPLRLSAAGDLILRDDDETRTLRNRIRAVGEEMSAGGLRVEAEEGAPLLLALTPFRPAMREASPIDRHLLTDEQLCAVFVGQAAHDRLSVPLLEDVFDLTPREAEVCTRLMLGASAREIAADAGRSLKTVRNQIQVIYEKVGVTSNVALMDTLSVFRAVGGMFAEDGVQEHPHRLSAQGG